jgi:hypothetical protein
MSQITDAVRKAARLKLPDADTFNFLQSLARETEDGSTIPAAAFIPARPEANPEQVLLNGKS